MLLKLVSPKRTSITTVTMVIQSMFLNVLIFFVSLFKKASHNINGTKGRVFFQQVCLYCSASGLVCHQR